MAASESVLELARRHVREGEQRVTQQEERVLGREGHDATEAEELLAASNRRLPSRGTILRPKKSSAAEVLLKRA
jgi:hypothetical protein